jgi:hypothetical protein
VSGHVFVSIFFDFVIGFWNWNSCGIFCFSLYWLFNTRPTKNAIYAWVMKRFIVLLNGYVLQ